MTKRATTAKAASPQCILLVTVGRRVATTTWLARIRKLLGPHLPIVACQPGKIAAFIDAQAALANESDASAFALIRRGCPSKRKSTRVSVSAFGTDFRVTRTQLRILNILAQRTGQWVSATDLMKQALNTHHLGDSAVIRVHIHSLRRSLGAWSRVLETSPVRGRGYRLASEYPFQFRARVDAGSQGAAETEP
jgi:DNA-binding winged helix-turn-helix (wHTH) protein